MSTVDSSLFCRLVDGDVEEDVDFVRFMIGWEKVRLLGIFCPVQNICLDKTNKQHHSFATGLFGTIDPTRKKLVLIHNLNCLTV